MTRKGKHGVLIYIYIYICVCVCVRVCVCVFVSWEINGRAFPCWRALYVNISDLNFYFVKLSMIYIYLKNTDV